MHFNASRSLTQPLLDCILYLTQYLYDPGNLPSSANQRILGKVYLRSDLSRRLGRNQARGETKQGYVMTGSAEVRGETRRGPNR